MDTARKYLLVLHQVEAAEARRLALMPSMVVQTEPRLYTYILPPIRYPDGRHYLKLGQHDLTKVTFVMRILTMDMDNGDLAGADLHGPGDPALQDWARPRTRQKTGGSR